MVKKNIDVVALGELLIDFTEYGESEQGNLLLEANPGGAPCNVLSILTKLGNSTAFIGKVGHDKLGQILISKVSKLGIDTTYVYRDQEIHTTLAFVHNTCDGERDFSFYRNPGADMMLKESEIPEDLIGKSKIFHFGTLSMTHVGNRKATKKALSVAKSKDCLISFDPNLRAPLWTSLDVAKKQVEFGLKQCDMLKISDNEIQWFTGEQDFDKGIKILKEKYNIPLIFLTMGKDGSRVYYKQLCVEAKSFIQENTIETTGAGDTFWGCIIHHILKWGMNELTQEKLKEMLVFANAAAAIITTRKGSLTVMPSENEIIELINNQIS